MRKLKTYSVFLFVIIGVTVQAQSPTSKLGYKIQSFRDNNRIIIRWAFENAEQWRYANTLSYTIERAEENSGKFQKINKAVASPVVKKYAEFYKLDTTSNAYKAMVFVFGEPGKDVSPEQDFQQYVMYFITTSYEIDAAVLTGSAFIDSSIEKGKRYTYRVTYANTRVPQVNNTLLVSEKNTNLPKGPSIDAVFSNRRVTLLWDTKNVKDDYFASVVERSTDSVRFERISDPIIKVSSPEEKPEDVTKISIADTIPNRVKFYYRIRGLNTFGELGTPGDIISGMAYPDLNVAPQIISVDSSAPNKLTIQWELADSLHDATARYVIYQSKKFDTLYERVAEVVNVSQKSKEITFKPKSLSTYFKIKAIGNRYNQITESEPFLYQLIDSVPPAAPVGIYGKVDSSGVVTLQWTKNTELDLLGYRVLRAQKKEDEFVILNAVPQDNTVYLDTLPMNQLNTVMYYRIAAVDARYNESVPSDIIEVKRPDLIPPAPPRVDSVVYRDNQVRIVWIKSFSSDVANYTIYKKASSDSAQTWRQLFKANASDTAYWDKDIQPGVTYYFQVEAEDSSKLKSKMSDPLSVNIPKPATAYAGVRNVVPYVSRQYKYIELSWQNNEQEANQYWIYRSAPGEELSLVKVLSANTKRFVDEDVKPNTTYKYSIKVVYNNGRSSKMARVEVSY